MKITKDMTFAELLEKKESAGLVLSKRGFHCIGCIMASGESIEEGAKVHGLSDKEIDELIDELNSLD